MDIRAYLDSGIVEEYCLGLLDSATAAGVEQLSRQHPAIDLEIRKTLETLARVSTAAGPRPQVKTALFQLINQLETEQKIDLESPPFIHRHSDAAAWNKAVERPCAHHRRGLRPVLFPSGTPRFSACCGLARRPTG